MVYKSFVLLLLENSKEIKDIMENLNQSFH